MTSVNQAAFFISDQVRGKDNPGFLVLGVHSAARTYIANSNHHLCTRNSWLSLKTGPCPIKYASRLESCLRHDTLISRWDQQAKWRKEYYCEVDCDHVHTYTLEVDSIFAFGNT